MIWIGLLALGVIVWATCIERFWFAIKRSELAILPVGSKDIVVLHISDIHMAPWQRYKQRWIRKLKDEVNPDLVINTGDNLGHRNGIKPVLDSLSPLTGVPGVFVNGSNDLYAPAKRNPFQYLLHPSDRHREEDAALKLDTDALNSGFKSFGWLDINNAALPLTVNGTTIAFMGTNDPHEGLDKASKAKAEIGRFPKTNFVIGVTHAPYLRILESFSDSDIVFAGHTHGGQVCWPFLGRALVTNCDLPTKYARGLHQVPLSAKKLWVNVCAGLGNSIYAPVRLACRPEVRVITLKARASSQTQTLQHLEQYTVHPSYRNEPPSQLQNT
jgi:predicted MPP superfamily phosphohydrolase